MQKVNGFILIVIILMLPYFAIASNGNNTSIDSFKINDGNWYDDYFGEIQEPSLSQQRDNKKLHTYRFLWLRTFHSPICLRLIVNLDGTGKLIVKKTDGKGGYGIGKLVENYTVNLSEEQVTIFIKKTKKAWYWMMPSKKETLGLDGARWILEGLKKGRYHVVERWSPEGGKFREAAECLIGLSKLDIEKIY